MEIWPGTHCVPRRLNFKSTCFRSDNRGQRPRSKHPRLSSAQSSEQRAVGSVARKVQAPLGPSAWSPLGAGCLLAPAPFRSEASPYLEKCSRPTGPGGGRGVLGVPPAQVPSRAPFQLGVPALKAGGAGCGWAWGVSCSSHSSRRVGAFLGDPLRAPLTRGLGLRKGIL